MEEEKEKRSEEERIDQRKGDLGDQSKGKETLIKEDIERREEEEGIWEGRREGFRGSRSSRLLGLVFCLMMMVMWFFIEDCISFC